MLLYYAVGGGLGHLTRARAFLHGAGLEKDAIVLSASPFASDQRVMGNVRSLVVPFPLRSDQRAYREWLLMEIARLRPTCLVLDTFPAGLFHEFDRLPIACPVEYVARYLRWERYGPVETPFAFAKSWVVEPLHPDQDRMVVARSTEVDRRPRLCDPPQSENGPPLPDAYSLVIHSGPADEVEELILYAERLRAVAGGEEPIVVATQTPVIRPGALSLDVLPALPLARNAIRIVTAAGFNAMRQWRGDPRHHALPFERRFDDQFLRASRSASAVRSEALAAQ